MIYTTIRKVLPSSNIFIEMDTNLAEVNLFNSSILTKNDYIHIFNVLVEKLPIYKFNNDIMQFKAITLEYVIFNYPNKEEIERVVSNFLDSIFELEYQLLEESIYKLREKIQEASEFVGVELHERVFNRDELTEKQLESIRSILSTE